MIASDTKAARQVLDEMLAQLEAQHWQQRDIFAVHLATEEALVNAIYHGNRSDARKNVHFVCRLYRRPHPHRNQRRRRRLRPGRRLPDPTTNDQLHVPCGRGVMLMRAFMSRVEFNEQGNAVIMEKDRNLVRRLNVNFGVQRDEIVSFVCSSTYRGARPSRCRGPRGRLARSTAARRRWRLHGEDRCPVERRGPQNRLADADEYGLQFLHGRRRQGIYAGPPRHRREIAGNLPAHSMQSTGKEVWFADLRRGEFDGGGDTAGGGDGPRSTPTVSDGKVYLLTPDLVVHCLDAADGKQIWKRDLMRENHGRNIGWNSAASVAVDGDLVFVGGGGKGESMLGLDKANWQGRLEIGRRENHPLHARCGHDPRPVRQVIFFMQSGLVSVDAKTGQLLWKYPFRFNVSTAISPVVSGDIVYLSAGYEVGSAAVPDRKARRPASSPPSSGSARATSRWSITGARRFARTATSMACSVSSSSRRGR